MNIIVFVSDQGLDHMTEIDADGHVLVQGHTRVVGKEVAGPGVVLTAGHDQSHSAAAEVGVGAAAVTTGVTARAKVKVVVEAEAEVVRGQGQLIKRMVAMIDCCRNYGGIFILTENRIHGGNEVTYCRQ